ncbi:MAG: hypothetical protein QGG36_16800 [Pirellulaceae bacterium]|jgi:hypothetical protein|nr:hypothetical protein [Pirellulaceae bacterium]MDP7017467.1 hypothetical protein [Pirellulaceae bacterium]
MAVRKKGEYYYADSQLEIREVLAEYSADNAYPIDHFADAECDECGGRLFALELDDLQGAAVRICAACESEHAIGDSEDYLDEAEFEGCECICGCEALEITGGVALYDGSEDVRWLYIGCRCPECGVTGCYGDWKNEFNGYQKLLARI